MNNEIEATGIKQRDLRDRLNLAKNNPALMVGVAIDMVQKASRGEITYVDPTNPNVFLLEMAATIGANCIDNTDSRARELYPKLAMTQDELYHHMSSKQYIGRFATPSTTTIQLAFNIEELIGHAAETDITGTRRIIIPKGTRFTVDMITFTLLYPLEIRVLPHRAIQCIYSVEEEDPIHKLKTNIAEWFYQTIPVDPTSEEQMELLIIRLDVKQVDLEYHLGDMMASIDGFVKTFQFKDQFCHCRVYITENGQRKEIETTHSLLVYDHAKPTAVLRLLDNNRLEVSIPHIYFNTNLIKGKVEVEVYTTKGEMYVDLRTAGDNGHMQVKFDYGIDKYVKPADTKYTAPLSVLNYFTCHAVSSTLGGTNGISFDLLRDKVINHAYYSELPITRNALANNAALKGYDLITSVDLVPDRIFHVTAPLPAPNDGRFFSGAACAIETVYAKMTELISSSFVVDNGRRMTIKSGALFRTVGGRTRIVSDNDYPVPGADGMDAYIQRINSLEYSYTPFFYCLDATSNKFTMRPYFIDKPKLLTQQFLKNNPTTNLIASADDIELYRVDNGFRILLRTRSGKNFKEIPSQDLFAQLAFMPKNEEDFAYLNGRFVGFDEHTNSVWEFILETNFDFDSKHNIAFTNFHMYDKEKRTLFAGLTTDFHLFLGVYDHKSSQFVPGDIDKTLGKFDLDVYREAIGVSHSSLRVQLGSALTELWQNARTVSSEAIYERYQEDVPATYPETVYMLDENGLMVFTDVNGVTEAVVAHRKGDLITDALGATVIKHRKGDVVLDESGLPVYANPREVARFLDIFLLDGIYKFATYQDDVHYREAVPYVLVQQLELDIKPMTENLLEETSLFFSPKKTMGVTKVVVEGGVEQAILNRFPFAVKYYMTETGYNNMELREAMRAMTHEVINLIIQERTVSCDKIQRALWDRVSTDNVMSIYVAPLGPDGNLQAYTSPDDSSRCSVKRKVRVRSDNTLEVIEDITVDFINHQRHY